MGRGILEFGCRVGEWFSFSSFLSLLVCCCCCCSYSSPPPHPPRRRFASFFSPSSPDSAGLAPLSLRFRPRSLVLARCTALAVTRSCAARLVCRCRRRRPGLFSRNNGRCRWPSGVGGWMRSVRVRAAGLCKGLSRWCRRRSGGWVVGRDASLDLNA